MLGRLRDNTHHLPGLSLPVSCDVTGVGAGLSTVTHSGGGGGTSDGDGHFLELKAGERIWSLEHAQELQVSSTLLQYCTWKFVTPLCV